MSNYMEKETLMISIDGLLEDLEYDKKHVRSPKKKRSVNHAIRFYSSIKYHLKGGQS